jgi:hypothetical protein
MNTIINKRNYQQQDSVTSVENEIMGIAELSNDLKTQFANE